MSEYKVRSTPELRIIPNKEHSHPRVGVSEVRSSCQLLFSHIIWSRSAPADVDTVFVIRASPVCSSETGTGLNLASKTGNSR